MFKYYKKKFHNRKFNKIQEGDGSLLKPMRFWQLLSRTIFHKTFIDNNGEKRKYSVDVHFYTEKKEAKLYIDKRQAAWASTPASFPVFDGNIEVEVGTYGLKRMHFVNGDKEEILNPDVRSAEGIRSKFHRNNPRISKIISRLAVIILLISLILGLPQIIELLTEIDIFKENFGTFTSPLQLPKELNIALLIGTALAALERALTLKHHWLIDFETNTYDDF